MLTSNPRRLPDNYRPLLLSFLLFFSLASAKAQTYNPSTCCTVSNKAYGSAQATSTDGRSWFYDATNFVMRDYNGTTEVLSYLNTTLSRSGHFPIFVHSGGTLQGNGVWLGGSTLVYWFKDSTGSANLVRWYTDSTGVPGGPFYAVANNLSEGNAGLIKGNLALDLVNNTSDAQKNAAAVSLTNHTMDGSLNTFLNIPNSALSHSTIGLTLNNTGATPQVTTTPAALGNSIVLAVPYANGSDSGFLRGTDWTFFHGKLDSVRISNDSVYNCVNGTCTLQSVIAGTGGVSSVNPANSSLLFSPSTGNVLGQVNPAWSPNWTGQHTFVSLAPIFSTLTTNGGVFYGSGTGQLLQSPAGTSGQIFESQGSLGPIYFTPSAGTVEGWLGFTPISNALGSTEILVGNGSNVATAVNVSGDATIANTGAVTNTGLKGHSIPSLSSGALNWNGSAWVFGGGGLSPIPNQTYLGNISGASAIPTALHIVFYNALDYSGIIGDSTTDCTAGLNNLIDTVEKYGGGTIWLPPGKYITSSTVTIPGPYPINIMGSGFSHNNVIALPSTSDPGYGLSTIFYNTSSGVAIDNKANGSQFTNFCLANATSTSSTTNTGLVIDSGTLVLVQHVQIKNFNTLLDSRSGVFFNYSENLFNNGHTYGVKVASYAGLDAGDSRLNNNFFTVTSLLGANDTLLYYPNSGGLKIFNNKFIGGNTPIYCPWQGFTDIDINHNSIENYTGTYGINITMANSSASLSNLHIIGNQIANGSAGEVIRVDATAAGSNIFNGLIDQNIFSSGSAATDTAIVLAGNITGSFKVSLANVFHNVTPIYSNVASSQIQAITFPGFVSVPLASRMELDMSQGNVFVIPQLTANDTIDIINGGAGNPFVIETTQAASSVFNLVAGNVSNQAQGNTTITLSPLSGGITYLYGVATGLTGGGGIITQISRNFTNGSIPFVKGGSFYENNTNLFWDNVDIRMGVKNNAPIATLHVADNQTSFSNVTGGIVSEQNSNTNDPARIAVWKSRGTYSSKTTTASGDIVGLYSLYAHNGVGYLQTSAFGGKIEGPVTSGPNSVPIALFVATKPSGWGSADDPFQDTANLRQIWWPNGQTVILRQGSPKSDTLPQAGYDLTVQGATFFTDDSVSVPNIPLSLATSDTTNYKLLVKNGSTGLIYYSNWPVSPSLKASADLTGQSGAVGTVTSFAVPGSGSFNTFSVGGYLTVTAVSLDVIQLQVTYTDETSTSRTQSFFVQGATTGISTTGANGYSPVNIRVKQGTTITVATVLTTGTGSITYDVGASITQLY